MAGKKIQGITVEIGGDTKGLNKALTDTNKKINSTQKELKEVNKALKLDPTNTDLLKQKQKLLGDQIGTTKDKLTALKQAKKTADAEMKQGTEYNEDEYRALQREISNTQTSLSRLKKQSSEVGNGVLMDISNAAGKVSDVTGKAGSALMPVTAGIIGFGTAAVAAMDQVDEGLDTIMKKTGATGDTAKELQGIYNNVAQTVPADFADIGAAVGELNTRLDFSGQKLEDASVRFLQFAKVNDLDVNNSIQLVTRAMKDAGIDADNYAEVLDMLTVAGQKSGVSIDSLTTNLAKYGAPMRALGLDTKNSIALFAGWEKAGVNTEIAFSGMKKAISTWGAAGKDSTVEFQKSLDAIKSAPDIASATALAIETFGAKAGPDLADAIRGGRFEVEDYITALEKSGGAVESTYGMIVDEVDDAQIAMQTAQIALHDIGETLMKMLGPVLKDVAEWVKEASDKFSALTKEEKENIVKTVALVAALGPALKIISGVTGGIQKLTDKSSLFHKGITKITSALGPAGAAVGITTLAIGGLIWGLEELNTKSRKETLETVQKSRDAFHDYALSMQDAADQTAVNMAAADDEADRLRGLWSELQTLVDENGNVISSDKERVDYILGELNGALGTQMEQEDGIVKKYQEQGAEIDKLIEKKRAQMKLEANEGSYQSALTTQTEGREKQVDLSGQIAEQEQKVRQARKTYDDMYQAGSQNSYMAKGKWLTEKQNLKDLQNQYNENAGVIAKANQTIQNTQEAHLAFEKGNYSEIEGLLNKQSLVYTVAGKASKESLGQQAKEMTNTMKELRKGLEEGQEGITEDMVKQAEDMAAKATQEYQKAGGKAGEGYVIGFDEKGDPIYKAAQDLGAKAIKGVKSTGKELKAVLTAAGAVPSDSMVKALSKNAPKVQQEVLSLLSQASEGAALSLPQVQEIFSAFGINASDSLLSSMKNATPETFATALSLLYQLQSATETEKPILLGLLKELGINMDDYLSLGLEQNKSKPINKSSEIGKSANQSMGSGLTYQALGSPDVDPTNTRESAVFAATLGWRGAQGYYDNNPLTMRANVVISGVQSLLDIGLSSLNLAGFYADGGLIDKPIAVMGENFKKELVIPLEGNQARAQELVRYAARELDMPLMDYAMSAPAVGSARSARNHGNAPADSDSPQQTIYRIEKDAIKVEIHTPSTDPESIYRTISRRLDQEVRNKLSAHGKVKP